MRQVFVRTPHGITVAYGDVFTGKKDSFGRDVFENDKLLLEYTTEFGSTFQAEGRLIFEPTCGGCHVVSENENLTNALDCEITKIIKVIDEKETKEETPFLKITT